jgi:hypothetical protein
MLHKAAHYAPQGVYYVLKGLYYAPQGVYYALQGLYYAQLGLYYSVHRVEVRPSEIK